MAFVIVFAIFLTIHTSWLFVTALAAPVLFIVVPDILASYCVYKLSATKTWVHPIQQSLSILFGAIPAYLIHGLGGIRGLVRHKYILNHSKQKTLMREV